MSVPEHWIEHRRGDNELVGWIVVEGDDFATVDLLGRISEPTDWFHAEQHLNELGIGYLASPYAFKTDQGDWVRVKLLEVSTEGIKMMGEDFGDITADLPTYIVPFPPGERLIPVENFTEDPALIQGMQPFSPDRH